MVSSNPNLATGSTRAACYLSGVSNTNVLYIAGAEALQESFAGMQVCSTVPRRACSSGTALKTCPSLTPPHHSSYTATASVQPQTELGSSLTAFLYLGSSQLTAVLHPVLENYA